MSICHVCGGAGTCCLCDGTGRQSPTPMIELRTLLLALRGVKGLSQAQVLSHGNLSHVYLSRLEQGVGPRGTLTGYARELVKGYGLDAHEQELLLMAMGHVSEETEMRAREYLMTGLRKEAGRRAA